MRRTPFVPLLAGAAASLLLAAGGVAVAAPGGGSPQLSLLRDGVAGYDALTNEALPVQADTTTEPSVAVNPVDPRNAVIGFQVGRVDGGGDATNGFATTKDAGRTWVNGTIPKLTVIDGGAFDRASDAVVAFGPDGTVYYSSLVFDDTSQQGLRSAIVNSTSHDGGLTWDDPTVVQDDDGGGLNDKNWLVVDQSSAAGHHQGRVYVGWDRVQGVIVKYSDDQGKTWVPPSPVIADNGYLGQGIGTYPLVAPNGDLVVPFMALVAPPATSTATSPEDLFDAITNVSTFAVTVVRGAGSVPTGTPLPGGTTTGIATYKGNPVRHQRAGGLLAAALDPTSGRIYVAWEDARYRTDAANDAVLAYSDDEGVTWSSPVRINPGATDDNLDHYNTAIAVGADGRVDVLWRQRQETASSDVTTYSTVIDSYVARSVDGGQTFGTPLQVNTGPSDSRFGAFSRGGLFQGDYDQVATGGDLTYVVRSESYAPDDSTPPPATPSAATPHHQTTWVAVLGTEPAGATVPDVGYAALLPVAAGGVLAAVLLARRRRPAR